MKKLILLLFVVSNVAFGILGWKGNAHNADGYSSTPLVVSVTSDDFVVNQNGRSVLEVSSDSPTAVNRDVILTCPAQAGHRVTLNKTGTGAWRLQDDLALDGGCGGAVKLANNYTAAAAGDGTLSLISTSTDYLEVGRANN